MARKTSTAPTRIYTYGCRVAPEHRDALFAALRGGHALRNELTAVERSRRDAYRAKRGELFPRLVEVEAEIEAVNEQIETVLERLRGERVAACQRVTSDGVKAELAALKERRRVLSAEAKGLRAEAKASAGLRAAMEASDAAAHAASKAAYGVAECYSGTRSLVCDAAKSASRNAKVDPRFARWDATGRVGVQLKLGRDKTGAPVVVRARDLASCTMLQIDPLPDGTWDTRSGRRSARTAARIRIGSDESKRPVWLPFEVLMHRPLPPSAVAKWAWILVRREGPRLHTQLQITIEDESFAWEPKGAGVAALDLGFKSDGAGGIEVGYLLDTRGEARRCVLPFEIVDDEGRRRPGPIKRLRRCDELQSINDKLFDGAKAALASWLKVNADMAPDWLREECAHLHAWRSRRKLARVAYRWAREVSDAGALEAMWSEWRTERQARGLDLFDPENADRLFIAVWLEWWRRKERHLYEWETAQRASATRWRADIFRVWVAELRKSYSRVLVEDRPLQITAPALESEDVERLNWRRRAAGMGALRDALGDLREKVNRVDLSEWRTGIVEPKMDADFARCWAMLAAAGEDCSMVERTTWNEARDFKRQAMAMAAE